MRPSRRTGLLRSGPGVPVGHQQELRTLVLGDIHGAYKAFLQCLERCRFDPAGDRLIFLGDAVDGWSQSPESVEELMNIESLVYLLGNHDLWAIGWLLYDSKPWVWLEQGGRETIKAYDRPEWRERKADHLAFLAEARLYYIDEDNRLFVHGGIEPGLPLEKQKRELLIWDRSLFEITSGVPGFQEIYIGHTPTIGEDNTRPLNFGDSDNIWRLDTGAGWWGKLTIMDVETKQFWQSDPVTELYPGEQGRI